jgi:hypothetical protein
VAQTDWPHLNGISLADWGDKYEMRHETMKLFAQLLEAYIPEDSSAMGTMSSVPGGSEVVQKLHKEMGLAHDQGYEEIDKISWSVLKDTRYGAWVLIKGEKGAGAIKADARGNGYTSVAFDAATGQVETYSNDRGGNNIDFLKSKIGKLRSFYIGTDTGGREKKRKERQERSEKPEAGAVSTDTLINKFRPLWLRAMTAAEADVKGMIATMIKNSAYEKAKRKMDQASRLLSAIERLETGTLSGAPDFVKEAVSLAVMMSAAHYYPEETGEIRKDYRSYSPQFYEGVNKLLKDISGGDTAKLGTVLSFFKRSLISG